MNRTESISAIVLLSFSGAIAYRAVQYPFGTLSNNGPGFFPFFAAVIMGILSLIILLKAILMKEGEGASLTRDLNKKKVLRVTSVFFSMVAYAFLLDKLGFMITTFLFTVSLFKFAESYNWIPSILGAIVTSFVTYLLFGYYLGCQFPIGFLGV